MKPLLIQAQPELKKVSTFHDLNDDRFAVHTEFDVEPVIDENERVRNAQPDGWKGSWHLVASIPMPVWQLLKDTWRALGLSKQEQQEALKRFLNDPDYSKWRTKRGRL